MTASNNDKRIRTAAALGGVAVLLLGLLIFSGVFVGYAVTCGGADIGRVSSRREAASAVHDAEALASAILGKPCSLSGDVAVTANLGLSSDAEELTDRLVENVDGILRQYAIVVDG